jgi:hypothetical protein
MVDSSKIITKQQVNIRLPVDLIEKINDIAEELGKSSTVIYTEAISEYVDRISSRICQGCHTVNKPESNFCYNCGLPMNPEGLAEFQRIREYIQKNPRVLMDNAKQLDPSL